jgi:hypothetical protein
MAVKTKAQILAEIASLLADNSTGDISALDLRTCLNDITDSYFEAPYKEYVALLTQKTTAPPGAIVLSNTFTGTPSYGYTTTGVFTCTLTGEFIDNKTAVFGANRNAFYERISNNQILINSFNSTLTVLSNDILTNTLFIIRVYA